jgi:hypothetical protein
MKHGEIMVEIQDAIDGLLPYKDWMVGLTNNPDETRVRICGPEPDSTWRTWLADSRDDALFIIGQWRSHGMRDDMFTESTESGPIYVFICVSPLAVS